MDIKVDNETIEKAINENINKAVVNAIGGYEIQQAISKKLSEDVAYKAIGEALDKAIAGIENNKLSQAIAEEMQRTIIKSVSHVVKESTIAIILKLKGIQEYNKEQFKTEHDRLMTLL